MLFSKSTKKEREQMSADEFGDPARKLYPILDQSDVDAAAHLIGKAKDPEAVKARIIAIAKRKGLKVPDAWQPVAQHSAAFALEAPTATAADLVLRSGKIFEAGSYPDKSYEMSPEELLAAAADFRPVPVDLEHVPTVLSGKLGTLQRVEVRDDDPWSLYGTVALPRWLDEAIGAGERKVSATWDRATKQLAGLALVINPRVEDAALLSAFSAAQGSAPMETAATYAALFAAMKGAKSFEGQMVLQDIHDLAARHGAVHKAGQANYHTAPELDALQQLHDLAASAGATCPMNLADSNAPNLLMPGMARYSDGKDATVDKSLWDQIKAYFSAAGVQVPDEPPTTPAAAPRNITVEAIVPAPADAALLSRNQALESEVARMRAERIAEKASEFAAARITEGTAFPAERQAIVAQYTQAALDDNHLGVVTFADGSKGNRVDLLAQQFAARPKHALDTERMPAHLAALVNLAQQPDPKKEGTDRETIDSYIAMTPTGQAHLSARNGGSN